MPARLTKALQDTLPNDITKPAKDKILPIIAKRFGISFKISSETKMVKIGIKALISPILGRGRIWCAAV